LSLPPDILYQRFEKQLKNSLPGSIAHTRMLPPGRVLQLPVNQQNFCHSAVLVLLFPHEAHIKTCLIRRPSSMKNHAGQIAFPGGKQEKEDHDLVQTALREAKEEIGLAIDQVHILGELSPVFVQVSNFLITPVVGWMYHVPEIVIDPSEVDEVIFISLAELVDEENRCKREVETLTGRMAVPGYCIRECFIWGATAMLLAELAAVYGEIDQL